MSQINKHRRGIFTFVLIASFAVWSVLPNFNHLPRVLETLQEHAEVVAEHGHSHGFAEDLLWAIHGHDHDEMDHDHSPLMLASAMHHLYMPNHQDWRQPVPKNISSPQFLIERPPRV